LPTFQDLKNATLFTLRMRGYNWGATAQNTSTDFDAPYANKLFLNLGYQEFLSRVQDTSMGALKVSFPTVANVNAYSLNPVPPNGATINPSCFRLLEATYTPANAAELRFPILSTVNFRNLCGGYIARLSNFSLYPNAGCVLFGRRQLDIYPGTAIVGDTISLTIIPSPMESTTSCANGGPMVNDADMPLIYPQYHMALVEYAVAKICAAANKTSQEKQALAYFEQYVQKALDEFTTYGEGDSEIFVQESYGIPYFGA
jgi:hypothetical protein